MATKKVTDLLVLTAGQVDRATDVIEISDVSASQSKKVTPNALMNISGNAVGDTDSQTLTNKTITAPTISGPTLSGTVLGTYTLGGTPTFPATVVSTTGSQTLTNKTLTSPTINTPTIVNPTITADSIAGFTASTTGTIYGVTITTGVVASAALANAVNTAAIQSSAITAPKIGTDSSFAWTSWTPTWTNLTVGNATQVARYSQIGKTVNFHLQFTWGSTTTIGAADTTFSLPVAAHSSYNKAFSMGIGTGTVWRSISAYPVMLGTGTSTSNAYIQAIKTNGGAGAIYGQEGGFTSTTPTSGWTTSDVIELSGTYEAA